MNRIRDIAILAIILVLIGETRIVKAQNPTITPVQITVTNALHTSCVPQPLSATITSSAVYCFGSDGAFVSLNGAAFTPAAAGITSINGHTASALTIAVSSTSGNPPLTVTGGALNVGAPSVSTTLSISP